MAARLLHGLGCAGLALAFAAAAGVGVARAERHGARAEAAGSSVAATAPAPAALEVPGLAAGADGACTRGALDGFYQSLAANEDGHAAHAARISFVGDSITASDHIPGRLREVFSAQFGDGGPGFVHIPPPDEDF